MLNLGQEDQSGVSAGPGEIAIYPDLNDVGRLKYKDANGFIRTLTSVEWPKNHLINGGFNFAQRQVPTTLTAPTAPGVGPRTYTADRFFACLETAGLQYQQVDNITTGTETGLSHRFFGRWKKITNAGKLVVGQILSAENSAVLRGKRVRVNLKLKRTVAAAMNIRVGLCYLTAAGTHDTVPGYIAGLPSGAFISAFGAGGTDPTLGANLTYLTPVANSGDGGTGAGTGIAGNALNVALTGTFARASVMFDVPSTAKNVIVLVWSDAQLAINDELNIGEAQLTEGVEIVDWISLPQVHELLRCLRFYFKTFPILVAPAQNGGLAGALKWMAGKVGAVAQGASGHLRFPVAMRATPTLTGFNPSVANAFVRDVTGAVDTTAQAFADTTDVSTSTSCTGNAATAVGNVLALHVVADAEL